MPPRASNLPSLADVGRALGISRQAVHKLARRGLPTASIAEAVRWHREHVDVGRAEVQRLLRPGSDDRVADAIALVEALESEALVDFQRVAPALRQALRAVPVHARAQVQLDERIWRQLIEVDNLMRWESMCRRWAAEDGRAPRDAPPTPADLEGSDGLLFGLACGELELGPPPETEP